MQHREGHQHHRAGRVGQHQQAGRVHEHAHGRDVALLEPVPDRPADQDAADLRHGHQGDDERRLRDRVAEAFLHVRDRVHVHRVDDEQREAVAEREQPESARAQRLARAVLALPSCLGLPRVRRGGRQAVHGQAVVFRTAAEHLRERPADDDREQAGGERRRAPAEALHPPGDQRHDDAAERQPE